MADCAVCSVELKFMNTPTFGSGKLSDGGIICTSCFKRVNNKNPGMAFKLKKHTLEEVTNTLEISKISESGGVSRLQEITAQIKSLNLDNGSAFLGRKEIDELPSILAQTEQIDNIVQGIYNDGIGILVSTNRRLLFVDKGFLYGLKVEDFPLENITSIQYETGLIMGSIKIHALGNVALIKDVDKNSARKFSEFIREKLYQAKQTNAAPIAAQPDILEQIEKLGKLKESGILTEEEFNDQKKKLLEKL